MRVEEAPHGSDLYQRTVALRSRVLREPLGLRFTDEQLRDEMGQKHFALVEGEAVLGCLVLVPQGESVKFRQMAIDPAQHGRGLGRQLLAWAEAWARGERCRLVTLHARQAAIGFYERCGYACVGEPFVEVTLPHIEMRKTL